MLYGIHINTHFGKDTTTRGRSVSFLTKVIRKTITDGFSSIWQVHFFACGSTFVQLTTEQMDRKNWWENYWDPRLKEKKRKVETCEESQKVS